MGKIIELSHIERVFNVGDEKVHALRGVSLDVDAGEYISVMGPSGSGKSTLLNTLGLLDRPTGGRYLLSGQDVTRLSEDQLARVRREQIGFVFQFFHLIPRLSAAENIELPLVLAGMEPEQRREKVDRILRATGLSDRASHRPDQLSGGQRQRVAIARATVTEPAMLLADEPTGNLDRASGGDVIGILEELNARGITLIVVTHDLELGRRARRSLHMVDGKIESDTRTT